MLKLPGQTPIAQNRLLGAGYRIMNETKVFPREVSISMRFSYETRVIIVWKFPSILFFISLLFSRSLI